MTRVGGAQDRAGRAVVLLERDDLEPRKVLRQALQVVDRRAAPAVDALVVVADRRERPRSPASSFSSSYCDGVGVLVLVDEQVAQAVAPLRARLGVALRAASPAGRSGRRSRPPGRPRAAPRSAASRAPRRARRRLAARAPRPASPIRPSFFQRPIAHCQRRASALSVLPPASFSTPSTSSLSRMLNCSFRPSRCAVAAQDAHAERVEGADHEVLRRARADQRLGALAHLLRRLVGEGDRRDLRSARSRPRAAARSCA